MSLEKPWSLHEPPLSLNSGISCIKSYQITLFWWHSMAMALDQYQPTSRRAKVKPRPGLHPPADLTFCGFLRRPRVVQNSHDKTWQLFFFIGACFNCAKLDEFGYYCTICKTYCDVINPASSNMFNMSFLCLSSFPTIQKPSKSHHNPWLHGLACGTSVRSITTDMASASVHRTTAGAAAEWAAAEWAAGPVHPYAPTEGLPGDFYRACLLHLW